MPPIPRVVQRATMITSLLAALSIAVAGPARAAESDSARVAKHEPNKYGVLVSATRTSKDPVEVPNAAAVVSGEQLRQRGARTLADAIQDVVGLDAADGSDNGSRMPNIGMWGLKEFDALLITLDGVPVGGPFNPSLTQIRVEDIDRIELVKGPQGTMYGVSAFAGMIQVFSRHEEETNGHLTLGGGSFNDFHGSAAVAREFGQGTSVRLSGSSLRADGWQDRTRAELDRGVLTVGQRLGDGNLAVDLIGYRDHQNWGTPLKFSELQEPEEVLDPEHNYAVGGANIEHRVFSAASRITYPLAENRRIENTLSYTRDHETSLTSFPGELSVTEDTLTSAGVQLKPDQTTVYEDLRFVSNPQFHGAHELVAGAAITWGRTVASGIGFDFAQDLTAYPSSIPSLSDIPVGDHRSFEDRRTFMGIYMHDAWTPAPRYTIGAGGRYDNANEKLHAQGQEVGDTLVTADDSRTDGAFSGDASVLIRLAQGRAGWLQTSNLFANVKSAFKPAAPNLTEAEGAEILEPEHTTSFEVGLKNRGAGGQVGLDVSYFYMNFTNLVVSGLDAGGNPTLMNAGKERMTGVEVDLSFSPKSAPGLMLSGGYAYHDAKFVDFVFLTPDGTLEDDSGKRLELSPQQLINARASYRSKVGLGGFAALRYQGGRPVDRDNANFLEPFTEYDAGAFYEKGRMRVTVTGRNLGDDRHVAAESDIGDLEFYIAPPRRVVAEATFSF